MLSSKGNILPNLYFLQLASEVVRAILRLSEVRSSPDASKTVPISFYDVSNNLLLLCFLCRYLVIHAAL